MAAPEVFTATQKADLDKAQRRLHDVLPLLDSSERCGVDCQEARKVVAELGTFFEAVKREFMSKRKR